jgi:hypothetical protein
MNRTLLSVLGGGALLYWWFTNHVAVQFPGTLQTGTPPPNPTGGTPTQTNIPPPASRLATIFTQLVANAGAGTTGKLTPYQWNYSLGIVAPDVTPPDPVAVFGSVDAASVPMTAADYWAVMSPYLHANVGLTGLSGLGGWLA